MRFIQKHWLKAARLVWASLFVLALGVLAGAAKELYFGWRQPCAAQPPPDPGERVAGLPPRIAPALQRALAKQPNERFATAGDFAAHSAVDGGSAGGQP